MPRLRTVLTSTVSVAVLLWLMTPGFAQQLPTGGSVSAGSASISLPNASTLNINQSTNQAIINWQSFSVGQGGTVNFNQPRSSSATLNRVLGSTPSSIAGAINAPGTVLLVNTNGVAITKSGVINTGSFAASTLDIKDSDFLAGNYKFSGNGASAAVVNSGRINVSDGGFAALLGGQVANNGVISARLGKVGLGAGEAATLDLSGDGFLSVTVPSSELGNLVNPDHALVGNKGRIVADGGVVYLSAATAANILKNAVNIPGSVRTNTVGSKNGRIVINGGAGGTVKVSGRLTANGRNGKAGSIAVTGTQVKLAGRVSASGAAAGTVTATATDTLTVSGTVKATASAAKGGTIDLTAANVGALGALIDASGAAGGGTIEIGGGLHGSGALSHALNVSIDSMTTLRADALDSGNGGTVAVWSDGVTTVAGTLTARGGPNSGDGGTLETSGHSVDFSGIRVNASAASGAAGTWLIDPTTLTIDSAAATTIANALNSGTSVTLQTNPDGTSSGPGAASSGAGDIVFASQLFAAGGLNTTLTVKAYHDIVINGGGAYVSISGSFAAQAGGTFTLNGALDVRNLTITTVGDISFNGSLTVNGTSNLASAANINFGGSTNNLGNTPTLNAGGNIQVMAPTGMAQGGTFNAYGSINVAANLTNFGTDPVTLRADADGNGSGTVNFSNGATFAAGGAGVTVYYNPSSYAAPTDFGSSITGAGSLTAYMLVNSAANLQAISNNLGGTYALGRDIDLSGVDYIPIGWTATVHNFRGLFDGQGHVISNMTIGAQTEHYFLGQTGLFWENDGTIRNVGVTGSISDGTNNYIGGLAGVVGSSGVVSNAWSAVSVSGRRSDSSVGGLVGLNFGHITGGSYATGSVSGGNYVGGLVGENRGVIDNTYATGAVDGQYAGGLVGWNRTGAFINYTYALGSVHGTAYTGGLVAENEQAIGSGGPAYGTILNSYAAGHLTGSTIGGLVGFNGWDASENQGDFNSQLGQSGKVWWSVWDADSTGTNKAFGNSYLDRAGYSSENVQFIGLVSANSALTSANGGGNLGNPYQTSSYNFIFSDPTPGNTGVQATGFAANWYMIDGSTRPFLAAEYSTTVQNTHQLQLIDMNGAASYALARDLTFVNDGMWNPSTGFSPIAPEIAQNVETRTYGSFFGNEGDTTSITTQSSNYILNTITISSIIYPIPSQSPPTLLSDTFTVNYVAQNFTGTFNGNGHTITNLTSTVTSGNGGLFATVGNGGTVDNLGLINPQIYADNHVIGTGSVGSIAGYNAGTITGVWATGGSVSSWFAADTGGLVGTNVGLVTQSYANVSVAGVNQAYDPATGFPTSVFYDHDGGLVGANYGQVTNTYALGWVAGNGAVGGLIGYNGGTVANSFTTGLTTNNYNYGINAVGALVGNNQGSVFSSFWDSSVATNKTGVGTGLTTAQMQNLNSYASTYTGWDFFRVWAPPNQTGQGGQSAAYYPQLYATSNIVVLAANNASQQYGAATPALTGGLYSLGDVGRLLSYSIGALSSSATSSSSVGTYSIGLQQAMQATDVGTATCSNFCVVYVHINGWGIGGQASSAVGEASIINSYTPDTGVTASVDSNGHLVLTAARSITVTSDYTSSDPFGIAGFYAYTPTATVSASMMNGSTPRTLFLPGTVTVTPAPLTVTATSVEKTYGQTVANGSTGYSVNGLVNGDSVTSVSFTSAGLAATATVDGGPYAITPTNAQGTGLSNYAITYVNGTLTIDPATLTYTANGATMTYGSAVPGLSGTVTGFVNGETLSAATTGTLAFGTTATSSSDVGNYAVNGSGLTATHGNYVFVQAAPNASKLSVTPASITVTANGGTSVYGSSPSNPGLSATGLQNGQDVSVLTGLSNSFGIGPTTGVAGGPYTLSVLGTLTNHNYTITVRNAGTWVVTPASITVTANGGTSVYGSSPANPGLSASGLQNGEDVSILTGLSNSFGISSITGVAGGPYALSVLGALTNANYTITTRNTGIWTVTPAPVTVTANGGTSVYGSSPANPGISATGLQNGEDISVLTGLSNSFGIGATTSVAGGPYTLSVLGALSNANYTITGRNTGLWTVTPAPITVTANGGTSVYGAAPTNPGLSATGLQNGEDVSVLAGLSNSFGISSTTSVAGGPYTLSVLGALTNANYTITTRNTGIWTVTPAPLTVTANNQSKTYGDTFAFTGSEFSSSGLQNGESIGSVGLASAGQAAPANVAGGPYTIVASNATGGTFNITNYTVTYVNGSLAVTPAGVVVSALGGRSTYGQSPADPGLSASGLKNGEDISVLTGLSNSFGIDNFSGAGAHALNVAGVLTNSNYVVTATVAGTWVVDPATLTYAANPATRYYGDVNPPFSGTVTGFVNGETLATATTGTLSFTSPATKDSTIGRYAISGSGLGAANYNFVQAPANATALTITPPPTNPFAPPPGSTPPATTVNVSFQTSGTPQASVSFIPARTASTSGDVSPAALAPDAGGGNNGHTYPPISEFDGNQYTQFKVPDYAAQASQATIFTMIARGALAQQAADFLIDTFWNGKAPDLNGSAGKNPVAGNVSFSDGAGHAGTPGVDNGFAIEPGKTNIAALLKSGPVMIGGAAGHTPAQWLLATGLSADGKSILCNDPVTGKIVTLALDPATGSLGPITGFYDPKSKGIASLADNSATLPAGATIDAIKDFVPSTFFAVGIR